MSVQFSKKTTKNVGQIINYFSNLVLQIVRTTRMFGMMDMTKAAIEASNTTVRTYMPSAQSRHFWFVSYF